MYALKPRPCSNELCNKQAKGRKYCTTCCSRMQKYGDFNLVKPKKRIYFFNEEFLRNQSKESSWFAGWVATDGTINKEENGIRIEICDEDILIRFAELLNYKGPIEKVKIREKRYGTKQSYRLSLHSIKLVKDFISIGIKPNKTKTLEMPLINQEYFYHFLRGVIEGDGCLYVKNYIFNISISSASKIFVKTLAKLVGLPHYIVENEKGQCSLRWWGQHSRELARRIYEDSDGMRLERKYNKYLEHMEYFNKKKGSLSAPQT